MLFLLKILLFLVEVIIRFLLLIALLLGSVLMLQKRVLLRGVITILLIGEIALFLLKIIPSW